MTAHVAPRQIAAAKLQHQVIYVDDLAQSKDFYMKLFDLQFSALNHPDSSAGCDSLIRKCTSSASVSIITTFAS